MPMYDAPDGAEGFYRFVSECKRIETDDKERFKVVFQRFCKEQYISTSWVNLFFTNEIFRREKSLAISISSSVDCYYTEGELQFSSFYFARQTFDLNEYCRFATDQEVHAFITSDKLSFEDTENFKNAANTWIRRKIAMINDSDVLVNYRLQRLRNYLKKLEYRLWLRMRKLWFQMIKSK